MVFVQAYNRSPKAAQLDFDFWGSRPLGGLALRGFGGVFSNGALHVVGVGINRIGKKGSD